MPYSVVQWATGNIGSKALRVTLEHPELTLAGLYVHSPDKAGRDAGELLGLPTTGVRATNDIADVLAARPDCVLYMPLRPDLDEVCRLLESGINVVTTCGMFHHPASMDPAVRERVSTACEKGGVSVHATGSSPGFISEAVPLVLCSIQSRVDRLVIDEYADLSSRNSSDLLFGIMGFGRPPSEFNPARATHLQHSFGPSLRLVADALGVPLDDLTSGGEVGVARQTVEIAAGTIEAGTVAAQRMTVSGMRDGRALLQFRATWYCSTDTDPAWPVGPTGWHVEIDGDAPLEIDLRFTVGIEKMAETTPGYTANRAVNAVPAVCAAAPGIRTTLDLPHITAALR
jgi:4-hydroxy-tetrahydrodipicolinate reductase